MKERKLGFVFVALVILIVLVLGMIIGTKVNDDLEQNGLCWSPSLTTNGETVEYELCIIQPLVTENGS